jgi:hypothetical protein
MQKRLTGPWSGEQNVAVRPVDFDSGRESLVQFYAGFFGHGQDVWLQADDLTLEELR